MLQKKTFIFNETSNFEINKTHQNQTKHAVLWRKICVETTHKMFTEVNCGISGEELHF